MSAHPYDRQAARYDARWAAYTERSLALLRPLLPPAPGAVLDLGCGTGALLTRLRAWGCAPTHYLGVDPSAGMLRYARGVHPGAAFVQGSAAAIPCADGALDLVVSASSLHDWEDAVAGLREVRRVLRPDGRLLLVDWCADYLTVRGVAAWLRAMRRPPRRVLRTPELGDALSAAGFRVASLSRVRISPLWGLQLAEGRLM